MVEIGLWLILATLSVRGALRCRGTTLQAACFWAVAASSAGLAAAVAHPVPPRTIRYTLDTLLLCPGVVVLGAKRPQDRAWQWVVLTLWLMLAIPAAQQFGFGQGTLRIGLGWQAVLLVLILIPWGNYLVTRHALASTLAALGQGTLLSAYRGGDAATTSSRLMGLTLLVTACLWCSWTSRVRTDRGWTRVWCDFRDAYGLVWTMRLWQRIEQTAQLQQWPVRLSWWNGIRWSEDQALDAGRSEQRIARAMRTALRRFVDAGWIDRRL